MSAHKFNYNGDDFVIETAQLSNAKWVVRIDPPGGRGDWIRQNPQQKTGATGKTTSNLGLLVEFDSEQEAIDTAKDNIKLGMY